ncbi:MAG TPA: YceI family protein [Solimonas sp.]
MKKLLIAAALACAPLATFAADHYTLDPHHTFARFALSHFGFSTFHGQFNATSGTATLDLAKKGGGVDVSIDVRSIATGVDKLDAHLLGADFFDAAKYPTITFKSNDFAFDGDQLASVTGALTMHGVTRPITLTVAHFVCKDHPISRSPACGADLRATLKRSDWGVSGYVPAIGDEVTLSIEVEATKQ